MIYAAIKAISYYVPEQVLTNDTLNTLFPEWSVSKITEKLGIENRYIVADDICASDLGYFSTMKLFEEHSIQPKDIDFILLCTQSPDYFLPTTACILQNRLNIPISAGALDFNLGCSGYIYGLGLAKGLIETEQASNVLLITAETYSKFLHPKDKSVRTIFGDAAATTLVSTSKVKSIENFVYGTDGRGAGNLIVKAGGMRHPITVNDYKEQTDDEGNTRNETNLYMNGSEVFIFTLNSIPSLVRDILKKSSLELDEIDLFIFHQANQYMLETLRKKLKIPIDKFFIFMSDTGNTVSATIPIALAEAQKQRRVTQGNKVMLVGFGVGYSWGGCIINF
jgi:3-oxoacyl-[acyl-carrier-protein] synthase-3